MDPEQLREFEIDAIADRVAKQLPTGQYGDKFVFSRRQVMALAASGLSVGALTTLGVDEATAQDAVGQVGTDSDRVDVFANDVKAAGDVSASAVKTGDNPDLPVGTSIAARSHPDGQSLILQNIDDSVDTGEGRANIQWYSDAGGKLASITAHPTHNHFSIYTRDSETDGTLGDFQKRLDIEGGDDNTNVLWRNIEQFIVQASDAFKIQSDDRVVIGTPQSGEGATDLEFRSSDSSEDQKLKFIDSGSLNWSFNHGITSDNNIFLLDEKNYSRYFEAELGGQLKFNPETEINHRNNVSENVVWQNGLTDDRPSDPVDGQRYFDNDLNRPVWYDGSEWIDPVGKTIQSGVISNSNTISGASDDGWDSYNYDVVSVTFNESFEDTPEVVTSLHRGNTNNEHSIKVNVNNISESGFDISFYNFGTSDSTQQEANYIAINT